MTWCAVIEQELCVNVCPIPDSSCAYRHRISNVCKAAECQGLTGTDLARMVGVTITEEEYNETFEKLKAGLCNEKT